MDSFLRIGASTNRRFLNYFRNVSTVVSSSRKSSHHFNYDILPPESAKPYIPVQIAGRQYLPGSNSKLLPMYLNEPREQFPLIIQVKNNSNTSSKELAKELREFLDFKLPECPAILFKGLPFSDLTQLSELVSSLSYKYIEYIGGAADRDNVVDHLNTASNDPPEFTVETHNEMAYSSFIPHKILFGCLKSPRGGGGEGIIADNKLIKKHLDSEVLKKFQKKGLKYISYLPNRDTSESQNSYMPWQQRLLTDCPKAAEKRVKALGYDFWWHDDGSLTYWLELPAFRAHPGTGESVWCNQAIPHHKSYFNNSPMNDKLNLPEERFPYHTQYGDGSEIEPDVVEHVRKVTWNCTVGFPWNAGDLLVLDNFLVQHGRMSFNGDRQLLVALTKD